LPFTDLIGPFLYRGGFDAIDLSSAIILLAIMGGWWAGRRVFEWTPLAKLGLIAYAFYLWHVTIFYIIARFDGGWNYVLRVVVAFSWTLAMALISWFLLERPLQRWVHRTTPRLPDPPKSAETSDSTTVDVGAAYSDSASADVGSSNGNPTEAAATVEPPERAKSPP